MDPLDPPPDRYLAMGRDVLRVIAGYYESLDGLPVAPDTTSAGLRAALSRELPTEGAFETQLEQVREVVYPGSRHNGHPRFFGYVASPAAPVAALADLLAASLDATVTAWRSAPAAAEVEHLVIEWIREILGYPAGSRGVLVSGGSMANLCGISAARDARAPVDVTAAGARALPGAMRLYVSREGALLHRKGGGAARHRPRQRAGARRPCGAATLAQPGRGDPGERPRV